MSGKTQQKTKNRPKNPLKSGNPAVSAAARAQIDAQPKRTVTPFKPSSSEKTSNTWTPSGNPEPAVKAVPKPRTRQQKKKDRFRKFGQIAVVLFFLGSMVATSFSGLGNLGQTTPAPEETSKVLLDQNGNPIDGSTPAQPTAPAGGEVPQNQKPEGTIELPAGQAPVGDGASNVIEIPAK